MKSKILFKISYSLTLLLLLLSLAHYHFAYSEDHIPFHEFIEQPQLYAGMADSFMGKYSHATFDGFVMLQNHHSITIHYVPDYAPPRFGEVLVYGTLNRDGSVTALRVHNYNYNYFIYLASGIAGVMVLIYFFTEWKITRRGFINA